MKYKNNEAFHISQALRSGMKNETNYVKRTEVYD